MKTPFSLRKNIPFFYNKTSTEFQKDVYERFDDMVVRHIAVHLADELWEKKYPFQIGLDFITTHLPEIEKPKMVELGCGVGRCIANLAQAQPEGTFWGIDYSYQMLKQAHDFWVEEKTTLLDLSNKGFPPVHLPGHRLKNLFFGLAKAEDLPFEDESQDVVISNFLFDRLTEPLEGLQEMYRILKPGGTLILITPLNFLQKKHWAAFYPPIKLFHIFQAEGFHILEWQEEMVFEEPLDGRGNVIRWNCLGVVARKAALPSRPHLFAQV